VAAKRFWIEIVTMGTAIAFALALLIATLGAAAATVWGQEENSQVVPASSVAKSYNGMVTCSKCGAKHSASLGRNATNCTMICIHGGSGFALVDGERVYQLHGDLTQLKKFAGQRAEVTGEAQGDTIEVSSIAAGT